MEKKRFSCVSKFIHFTEFRSAVFFIVFLLMAAYCVPFASSQYVNSNVPTNSKIIDGRILFAPMWGTTTYLIDSSGAVNHTWPSSFLPGVAVLWLGDGTILRTIRVGLGPATGGAGGGVQKVESDGTVSWDFRYNTNGNLSHHDITLLPNGDVLMIAWETKTRAEAIAAGMNPSYVSNQGLFPDHIIEVKPTGPTSGDIVWEWHVWDHLIQDYDSSKANYGVVGDHPELVNINYGVDTVSPDWLHTNSIDYNPEFDQILLSIHNFNEVWVIDHSTTTEEAAGHTGGNSGKGGDLLYRWGNPAAYDRGTASDEKLFGQHDASWIPSGYPGDGDILIFNNGEGRPGGQYSSVDEITPPVNATGVYYLAPHSIYGPSGQTWIYTADPPTSFYVGHLSSAQRLADGDTLICDGETGEMFEVTPDGATVWDYTSQYPSPLTNELFKVEYIPPEEPPNPEIPNLDCSGSLSWSNVKPGATVTGSFQVQNIGGPESLLNWTVNRSSVKWGTWTFTPASGSNLTPEDGPVTVQVSVVVPNEKNTELQGFVQVQNRNNASDFDTIPVYLKTSINLVFSTTNPFLNMMWQWLQLLIQLKGKMTIIRTISHAILLPLPIQDQR